jgi:hypothetical protein
MKEKKETGFFGQIKNQIITTVGVIITAAGGLVVTNMEAIFGVQSEPEVVEIKNEVPKESSKDTIVVIQKKETPVLAKPEPPKEKEFDW